MGVMARRRVRKRKKAARILRSRPRSWLGVICVLLALAGLILTRYEADEEGMLTDPGQIFAAFSELNIGAELIGRMRPSPSPPKRPPNGTRWRTVIWVADGDTIKLDGGEMVRLIGVDTPESDNNRKLWEDIYKIALPIRERDMIRLGKIAGDFTTSMVLGRRCWLEYENEPKDRYGRTLAYIHLEDGRILNEEILSQGYGKVYLSFPFRYRQRYVLLQTDARMNQRGLWKRREEPIQAQGVSSQPASYGTY